MAAPAVATVSAIYRGWLSCENNALFLTGEGNLAARLKRDVDRFGHRLRLRFFHAHNEIPLGGLRHQPWHGEGFIRVDDHLSAPGVNVVELLRSRVGQFLHLEIEWEL